MQGELWPWIENIIKYKNKKTKTLSQSLEKNFVFRVEQITYVEQ